MGIWGIPGSYYNLPKAIFYLLKGDYRQGKNMPLDNFTALYSWDPLSHHESRDQKMAVLKLRVV